MVQEKTYASQDEQATELIKFLYEASSDGTVKSALRKAISNENAKLKARMIIRVNCPSITENNLDVAIAVGHMFIQQPKHVNNYRNTIGYLFGRHCWHLSGSMPNRWYALIGARGNSFIRRLVSMQKMICSKCVDGIDYRRLYVDLTKLNNSKMRMSVLDQWSRNVEQASTYVEPAASAKTSATKENNNES
jgi:hypothetical protein